MANAVNLVAPAPLDWLGSPAQAPTRPPGGPRARCVGRRKAIDVRGRRCAGLPRAAPHPLDRRCRPLIQIL